jgi:hypothetical protein
MLPPLLGVKIYSVRLGLYPCTVPNGAPGYGPIEPGPCCGIGAVPAVLRDSDAGVGSPMNVHDIGWQPMPRAITSVSSSAPAMRRFFEAMMPTRRVPKPEQRQSTVCPNPAK